MCASCGCGCKHGIAAKGCKCSCKACREARMSVEKSFIFSKAERGFDAIADALLDDVVEDEFLIAEDGTVYVLVDDDEVEKGLPSVLREAVRADKKVNTGATWEKIKRGHEFGHTKNQDQTRQMFDRMVSAKRAGQRSARNVAEARKAPEFGQYESRWSKVNRATERAKDDGAFNARSSVRAYGSQPGKLLNTSDASAARRAKIAERSAALKPGAAGRSALAGETGGTTAAGLQAAGRSSSDLADRALAANARAGLSRPAPKKKGLRGLLGR